MNFFNFLILFTLLYYTPQSFAEIELENVDDLSFLDEFEENQNEKEEKQKNNEQISLKKPSLEEDIESIDLDFPPEDEKNEEATLLKQDPIDLDEFSDEEVNDIDLTETIKKDHEINYELLNEVSSYNKEKVDKVVSQVALQEELKYSNFQLEALKVQLNDIVKSPIRLGHLSKGTKLIRINDGKIAYTTKPITVKIHTLNDFNRYTYILNKKDELAYKVQFEKVANIKDVTNLYREPHFFKRISKKTEKYKIYDDKIPFSIHINLHGGIGAPNYTNKLISGKNSFVPLIRSEFTINTKKDHLFNLGFSTVYETMTGELTNGGTFQYTSLSIGPAFSFQKLIPNFNIQVLPRISSFSQLSVGRSNDIDVLKLSETSLMLSIDYEFKYEDYGHFAIGISTQRKWITTSTQNADYTSGTSSNTDDSYALFVGHRSDWP